MIASDLIATNVDPAPIAAKPKDAEREEVSIPRTPATANPTRAPEQTKRSVLKWMAISLLRE